MKRVLVAGASGLLGHGLTPALRAAGFDVIAHGRRHGLSVNGDLCDAKQANEILDRVGPDVIVNLVALTDVDKCEEQPHEAFRRAAVAPLW